MKKLLIFTSIICALMLAVSCANGSKDPTKTQQTEGPVTIIIDTDSTNESNTMFDIQYERSAYGADEKVILKNLKFTVTVNGKEILLPNTIEFNYSEYSGSFSGNTPVSGKIEDLNDAKIIGGMFSLNTKLCKGDEVVVNFESADVYGSGAKNAKLDGLRFMIVDNSPEAGWWKVLINDGIYRQLKPKFNIIDESQTGGNEPTSGAFDGRTYVEHTSYAGDLIYKFENGIIYVGTEEYTQNSIYSVSGDTIKTTFVSQTYEGVTYNIDDIIKLALEDYNKDNDKTEEELKEYEKQERDFYNHSSECKFTEDGDTLTFISPAEYESSSVVLTRIK